MPLQAPLHKLWLLRHPAPHYEVLVAQSCLTLCDPMDRGSQGSSVHGILQARTLERVAIPPPLTLPASQRPQRCLQPVSPGPAKPPHTTLFYTKAQICLPSTSLQKLTWSLMLAVGATQIQETVTRGSLEDGTEGSRSSAQGSLLPAPGGRRENTGEAQTGRL